MAMGKCPAYSKQCRQCRGMNHCAEVCYRKQVHAVWEEDKKSEPRQNDDFYVRSITIDRVEIDSRDSMKTLTIQDSEIEMKLDTGAQVNILSETDFQKIKSKPELKYAAERLSGYGGQQINVKGKCSLIAENKGTKVESVFFIVPGTKASLLGKKTC